MIPDCVRASYNYYVDVFSKGSVVITFNMGVIVSPETYDIFGDNISLTFNLGYSNLQSTVYSLDTSFTGNPYTSSQP